MLYVPSYMSPSGGGGGGLSSLGLSREDLSSMPDSHHQHHHHQQQHHQKRVASGSKLVRFESRTSHLRLYRQRQQRSGGSGADSDSDEGNEEGEAEREERDDAALESQPEQARRRLRSRPQPPPPPTSVFHDCHLLGCERVRLNVSGMHFETRLGVLNQHPRTLLGNPQKRARYFDQRHREYFFDRHRPTFEAVFNYYQYGGKLKRPPTVTDDIFLSELEFYEIEREVIDAYKKDEGYISETVVLPEHPVKRAVWMLFEYPETSAPAFLIAIVSVVFTIVSIILFCAETLSEFKGSHCVPSGLPNFLDPFFVAESACTAWFTIELFVRFLVCPCKKAFMKDIKNAVDLSAIVPYYVTLTNVLVTMSCEGARSSASLAFLRVVRLIRVFKLTKHSADLQVLVLTFRASIEGLGLFLVALIVCILLFSSTIYYVESEVKGSQIESIPDAFWWAVITMCTVGYGDKVPKGPLGMVVGSVCAIAGVLTLAIPVPIITENFNKFYTHKTGRGRH